MFGGHAVEVANIQAAAQKHAADKQAAAQKHAANVVGASIALLAFGLWKGLAGFGRDAVSRLLGGTKKGDWGLPAAVRQAASELSGGLAASSSGFGDQLEAAAGGLKSGVEHAGDAVARAIDNLRHAPGH
jgi:hypothetical protein